MRAPCRILALLLVSASPALAQAPDPAQFVQAPPLVPIGEGAEVGWSVRQEVSSGGQTMTNGFAIVGERDGVWLVEHESPAVGAMQRAMPQLEGALLGLEVRKEDGKVLRAVLGKPGESGRQVKISEGPGAEPPEAEEPVATEDVTIGLGTFPAERYENNEVTSWMGTEGALDGAILKVDGPGDEADFELAEMPTAEALELGEREIEARTLRYGNGMTYVVTDDPIVRAFFPFGPDAGIAGLESDGFSMRLTHVSERAEPRLNWE